MPLTKIDKAPAPSRTPYALLPQTFHQKPHGVGKAVDAVWAGRKKGRTTISAGTLSLWWQRHGEYPDEGSTLAECIEKVDPRYGGDCYARWDGECLWVNPRYPLTPEQQVSMSQMLDSHLTNFPAVPEGHDGWYYLTP